MHREELQLPFKRYQMQPVWRADRPQKGRYREFWQFDGDIVGSDSLLNEVELMQIVDTVFSRFGVRVQIKINNRKILSGIAEVIGAADKIVDITVAIDKLDKIGLDNVNTELREDGLTEEQIEKLQPIITLEGTNDEKLNTIADVLKDSEIGLKGVEETRYILSTLNSQLKNELQLDLTLARGLNYYTGAIFEVKALDVVSLVWASVLVSIVSTTCSMPSTAILRMLPTAPNCSSLTLVRRRPLIVCPLWHRRVLLAFVRRSSLMPPR